MSRSTPNPGKGKTRAKAKNPAKGKMRAKAKNSAKGEKHTQAAKSEKVACSVEVKAPAATTTDEEARKAPAAASVVEAEPAVEAAAYEGAQAPAGTATDAEAKEAAEVQHDSNPERPMDAKAPDADTVEPARPPASEGLEQPADAGALSDESSLHPAQPPASEGLEQPADAGALSGESLHPAQPPPAKGGRLVGLLAILACFIPGICLKGGPVEQSASGRGSEQWDRGAAELRVRVLGPDEQAVAGAEIWLFRNERGPATRTNAEGLAVLKELAEGGWGLLIEAQGLARYEQPVNLPLQGELLIRLEPGTRIAGHVRDEEGKGLANASIIIRAGPDGRPFEAQTDEDGRFELDTLPTGTWQVEVRAEGFEVFAREVQTAVDRPVELDITLRRAGTIRGLVRNVSGEPAADASVIVAGSGVWPPRQTRTGIDGRYELTGIPEGVYELRARQDGAVSTPREGLTLSPGQTLEIDLQLIAGRSLRGRVTDRETGKPIAGASVLVTEEVLGLSPTGTKTDADGRFFVTGLLDRPHRISLSAEGYVSRHGESVEFGKDLELSMQRGAVIEGVVLDHLHRPVEGASIDVLGIDDTTVVVLTTSEASFREALFSEQLNGPGLVEAGELGVTLGAVPLVPLSPASVEGALPLGDGAAASMTPQGSLPSMVAGPVTDREGRFRIVGLPPGRVQLLVAHPDHAPLESDPMQLVSGEVYSDVELILPEGAIIEGRVVDSRGFGVGALWVELRAELEPTPRSIITNDDGTFELRGVVGAATLTAMPTALPPSRIRVDTVSGTTHSIEIKIDTELNALSGDVLDPSGQPVAGALVALSTVAAATPVQRTGITEDDGSFAFDALPAPPYRVEVDHPDFALFERELSSANDTSLRLEIGGNIVGRLVEERSATPIADGRIRLLRGRDVVAETVSDGSGDFSFTRITIGNYSGLAHRSDYIPVSFEVVLKGRRGGAKADVGELLLSPGGSLTGQISDRYGRSVKGAEVTHGSPADWNRAVRSDEEGRFLLEGIPPGMVVVRARHPAAGEAASRPARVRAGETPSDLDIELPASLDSPVADGGRLRTGVAIELEEGRGRVFVLRVIRGSAAERAGLREGDRILAIDDQTIGSVEEAEQLLRGASGVEAHLDVRRAEGGQERLVIPRERHVAAP